MEFVNRIYPKNPGKVPHGYKVALPLAVGYPDESPGPRPRWNLDDIVYYEEYGKRRAQ